MEDMGKYDDVIIQHIFNKNIINLLFYHFI